MSRRPSETAAERLSRLLSLVPWLLAHDGITIDEAATHFGITPAQLVSDLDLLIVSGLPGHRHGDLVDIQYWDEDRRIHVLDPQTLTRPPALTPVEAGALLVALRLLAQVPGDHDRAAVSSATGKVEAALAAVGAAWPVTGTVREDDPALLDSLRTALRERRRVRIRYASASADEVTERLVDPLSIDVTAGPTYLQAWCHAAEAVRVFRTDRIQWHEVLDETFTAPSGTALTVDEVLHPAEIAVEVDIDSAGHWLVDEPYCTVVGPVTGASGEGLLRIRLEAGDEQWLVGLLLRVGAPASRVHDDALASRLRAEAAAALAAYDEEG